MTGQFLDIRGIRYFVRQRFKEENEQTLVLLHGFAWSGELMQSVADKIPTHINLVIPDLLGHGKTDVGQTDSRYSAAQQCLDLKQILDETTRGPISLAGYSMGGRLAASLASQFPHDLKHLIIICSGYGLCEDEARQERRRNDARLASKIEDDLDRFFETWNRLPVLRTFLDGDSPEVHQLNKIQLRQKPEGIARSLRGFGTGTMPCLKSMLEKFEIPTLLCCGSEDSKYIEIMREMHTFMPQSTLKEFPQAGHRLCIEKPGQLAAAISAFID